MLDLQHTSLPHETEYILDGLCDDNDLDGPTSLILRLYGDRPRIGQIVAGYAPDGVGWYKWRRGLVDSIVGYADALFSKLSIEQQGAMVSIGLAHAQSAIERSARYMAESAISDRVEGGMCENYNRPPLSYKNDEVTPYPKTMRRLKSQAWIRRYVKRDDESCRLRKFVRPILERAAKVPPDAIVGGIETFREEFAAADRRRRAHEARQWAEVNERIDIGIPAADAIQVRVKPGVRRKFRLQRREYRKTARRAARTAVALIGPESVSTFVRGETVNLLGQNLMIGVQLRSGVARTGHGCVSVSVATRDAEPLATLCYYVEDTPALDQLTALALHAAAGEEADILNAANLTSVTQAGAAHPMIVNKALRLRAADVENWIPVNTEEGRRLTAQLARPCRDIGKLRDERNADYWRLTGDVWLESLGVTVLGVRGRKMMLRNAETRV